MNAIKPEMEWCKFPKYLTINFNDSVKAHRDFFAVFINEKKKMKCKMLSHSCMSLITTKCIMSWCTVK